MYASNSYSNRWQLSWRSVLTSYRLPPDSYQRSTLIHVLEQFAGSIRDFASATASVDFHILIMSAETPGNHCAAVCTLLPFAHQRSVFLRAAGHGQWRRTELARRR